ncbi:MAG: hypothetical protein RL538_91 [Candidatus Parcubacteria bacterium]|jgi:hypothetical protein
MKKALKYIIITIILIFALIGMAFTAVFVGMQFGLTNVRGSIEERNSFFGKVPTFNLNTSSSTREDVESGPVGNGCVEGFDQTKPCEWHETVQWEVVKGGLQKDQAVIARVASETGVPARMIAAAVMPEQMRFFAQDENREVFKRYFEPLKILASLSQFSLGVSGMKQKTAEEVERHITDTTSSFYPGPEFANLIAYSSSTTDKDNELFNRLTNEKDHYYSYLYTAIYLKEIETQWKRAGYDVGRRPDVLVTLFNLGFDASEPKINPQVAGAPITIGGQKYSFGDLGATFYHSDELLVEFPK